MYDVLKTARVGSIRVPFQEPSIRTSTPDPCDPWLFTDPDAREAYAQQNRLDQLKSDILAYAMYEGHWAPAELEFACELQHLLDSGLMIPKGTFGHLSPHPTVYRALGPGPLAADGQNYHFEAGDDILFVPWLARVSRPGLSGLAYIGRLQSIPRPCLCCEAFPLVGGYCERALAILHQTLPRPATRPLKRQPTRT